MYTLNFREENSSAFAFSYAIYPNFIMGVISNCCSYKKPLKLIFKYVLRSYANVLITNDYGFTTDYDHVV